jgi:hypothetical protein
MGKRKLTGPGHQRSTGMAEVTNHKGQGTVLIISTWTRLIMGRAILEDPRSFEVECYRKAEEWHVRMVHAQAILVQGKNNADIIPQNTFRTLLNDDLKPLCSRLYF